MKRSLRHISAAVLVIALCLAAVPLPAWAQDSIQVILNGKTLAFDVPPANISGRLLVPLRKVFEALGATVAWDPATRTVTAWKGPISVRLTVGSPEATVNERPVQLDVPPQVVDGRTLVPLRFVSEALSGDVVWDGATRTVTIVSPEGRVRDNLINVVDLQQGQGNWTVTVDEAMESGWKKLFVNEDPDHPMAWLSSALLPVGLGSKAWVLERTCRSGETEVTLAAPLGIGDAARACRSTGADGSAAYSLYIAAGDYVLVVGASARDRSASPSEVIPWLAFWARHQWDIVQKVAGGQPRPAPPATPPPVPTQPNQPPPESTVKPLEFNTPLELRATVGQPFSYHFCNPGPQGTALCGAGTATVNPKGGTPPYTFSTEFGTVPAGFRLDMTGHLSGTPAPEQGGRDYTIKVCTMDKAQASACRTVRLVIEPDALGQFENTSWSGDFKAEAGQNQGTGGEVSFTLGKRRAGPDGTWQIPVTQAGIVYMDFDFIFISQGSYLQFDAAGRPTELRLRLREQDLEELAFTATAKVTVQGNELGPTAISGNWSTPVNSGRFRVTPGLPQ